MTRAELITSYANGANRIREAIKDIPVEALDFKPSPTAWSVRQIVTHMPDSEASSYVRARKIIAQTGVTVDVYDQDAWADSLFSGKRDINLSLSLFDLMRKSTAELLTYLDESVWENNFVMHPDDGKLTLGRWLEIYENHVTKHVGQIRRTFEAWQAGR
jgi:uncharacterized damage-inducible protein DinB